ncbi:spore coat protein [Thalassorhabdus alkalitolerans]|uniref:Spore coat protein n=1 Tax=Thalassorhabdus alkalitolerans TaxID=2282697 RepID=A0ABW0YP55_9BACI
MFSLSCKCRACRIKDTKRTEWRALDDVKHPLAKDDATQSGQFDNKTIQLSDECILVKDSADVTIRTTDTKAAVSLQAGIQAAIILIISIAIGDDAEVPEFTQELIQKVKTKQLNYQKTIVENSRGVDIRTTDTQVAVNIQLMLQLLLAIAVIVDIL